MDFSSNHRFVSCLQAPCQGKFPERTKAIAQFSNSSPFLTSGLASFIHVPLDLYTDIYYYSPFMSNDKRSYFSCCSPRNSGVLQRPNLHVEHVPIKIQAVKGIRMG
ncbi:hypothetical protein CEXT_390421 [Caerostris extrusa]|uniref:Uncharacterized protein n=1 Tax=Caerostris extrusa TaxID=172846 RepID=A0AAV4QA42_CAEEX|nr:hypothetical protein CEXT_390421 [Caerostris extrusa]